MYQIFGIKTCLLAFAWMCFALAILLYFCHPASTLVEFFRLISSAVTISAAIVYALGQTFLFPILCRKIFKCFPDIEGNWASELSSNWPKVAEKSGIPVKSTAPITAQIKIISRLFFVKIQLASDSGYSKSHTLSVKIWKDKEDGRIELCYIYDNITNSPETTDSSRHFGAACLEMHCTGKSVYFDGVYWTNRNWQNALNTAGTIILKRPAYQKG